jgi:hypothetical protein
LDTGLAHALGVELVDFRLEESEDKREEDFGEDGGPLLVLLGSLRRLGVFIDGGGLLAGQVFAEKHALQGAHGTVAYLTARVDALAAQASEDGRPVRGPCLVVLKMGLCNQHRCERGQIVDESNRVEGPLDNDVVLFGRLSGLSTSLLLLGLTSSTTSLGGRRWCAYTARSGEVVGEVDGGLVVVCCNSSLLL